MTDELEQPTMEELLKLRARLKNYHADEDGCDTSLPIDEDPRFMDDSDTSNLEPLRRWVQHWRAVYAKDGSHLDTGMRCVMNGGDVIYLDPETLVDLMDELDALRAKTK